MRLKVILDKLIIKFTVTLLFIGLENPSKHLISISLTGQQEHDVVWVELET